ncbi:MULTISPECIES: DNA methyltransferase [Pasteurellaceae]|uniref:Methyltransferase n=1 Tax=Pasteurella atlantica TaxID=2827233 RepID=A0AAW8CN29_9PAST|nr:DNA methyltransferase [Pasteurella atlantica]MBR0574543.1 DNA adenine methylase [Pasteurella atlantica]MDP8040421.1 DNA methyltransferase [Pasteurella atlantica]MDP8042587.1 DNA methyltransferase [Pasteurella atlantica]MDP8044689.1 DNA methyltransferase [Pasteurella atlantica]MDP8046729.1 DNA methyltransferase [Pasteurella atlantica]
MKFNDVELGNWKDCDINTDSLWLISERDKHGKHSNHYHGNFIPQIPYQLIKRYTKKNETVLDLFLGSGTTLFECENLDRNLIGFDINNNAIDSVKHKMVDVNNIKFDIQNSDVSSDNFDIKMMQSLDKLQINNVQFLIMHPPYLDIVKFTDKKEDLSHIANLPQFIQKFQLVVINGLKYLEKNRYFAVVIGDVYKQGEIKPLPFYIMDMIKRNFKVKLKGIVIKNVEGNRGKLGQNSIWRYRALSSDYFIFKHEYILIFKKEF